MSDPEPEVTFHPWKIGPFDPKWPDLVKWNWDEMKKMTVVLQNPPKSSGKSMPMLEPPFEPLFSLAGRFDPGSIDGVLEKGIPGFHEMHQRCPLFPQCGAPVVSRLRDTIIHLNDEHRWPREKIADWLDTLDHDLRFRNGKEGMK